MRRILPKIGLLLLFSLSASLPGGAQPDRLQAPGSDLKRHIDYVQVLMGSYRYDAAKEVLAALEDSYPEHPLVRNYRAVLAQRMQRPDEGERLFRAAWVRDPQNVAAQFNLAESLFSQRRYEEAATFYQSAVHLEQLGEMAAFKRYLCVLRAGREQEAKAFASGLKPSLISPLFYVVQAAAEFEAGRTEAAMYYITSAKEMYGDKVTPWLGPLVELGWMDAMSAARPAG